MVIQIAYTKLNLLLLKAAGSGEWPGRGWQHTHVKILYIAANKIAIEIYKDNK